MQTTNGLLVLTLIDIVAAASDVDGHEGYGEFRRKVGEFIVENRVPSKIEFDALQERGRALVAEFTATDGPVAPHEDPSTHIAPAALKSDMLRTASRPAPAGEGVIAPGALRDPHALENQRPGAETEQARARAESAAQEQGVAYEDGARAITPSDQSRPGAAETEQTGAETGSDETEESEDDGGESGGTDTEEPDFEGSTKKDLQDYLDERREAGDEEAVYENDANKATLVHLAKEAYARHKAKEAEEANEGADGGE